MKKICIVVSSSLTVKAFLLKHIKVLLDSYDITIVSSDKVDFEKDYGMVCKSKAIHINRKISIWNDLKSVVNLYNFFSSEKFNLVLSVTPKAGLVSSIASFLANIKIRIHFFTGQVWATKTGIFRWVLKSIDKLIAQMTTTQLIDSHSQRAFLVEQDVVDLRTSHVLLEGSISGVDTSKFKKNIQARKELQEKYNLDETQIVFMFIGRLNVDKGLLDLNEVFFNLFEKYSQIRLFLVGPDEENMTAKMSDLIFHENVIRIDYVSNPEYILNIADVLVLPSYREGFGTIVIEAASMGIPCIGSDIYGLKDAIINGKTGLLHQVKNKNDMIEKYEYFINNKNKIEEFGKNAKDRVDRIFQDEIIAKELKCFVDKLLGKE